MIAEVTIDIDDAFNSLSCMDQAECVSNFLISVSKHLTNGLRI